MRRAVLRSSARELIALCVVSVLLLISYAGCGDSGFKPEVPGIALVPDSTAVKPGGQVSFTAVLTALPCDSLGWYVNGERGGNQIYGTITSDGVYTAPIFPPDQLKITVKAVCAADTTYFAQAVVLIVVSVPVQLENYVQVLSDKGAAIKRVPCSGASDGWGVDGLDVIGDAIVCEFSVEHSGDYSGVLRAATTKGSHVSISATISGVELAEDQVADFPIIGEGFG